MIFVSTVAPNAGNVGTGWGPFMDAEAAKQFIIKQAAAGVYYLYNATCSASFEKPVVELVERSVS